VAEVLLAVGALGFVASIWMLVVNKKTHSLRRRLIDFAFRSDAAWRDRVRWYDALPDYNAMLWRLFFFRNPRSFITGRYADEFFAWRDGVPSAAEAIG